MAHTPRNPDEHRLLSAADWWTRLREPQLSDATLADWLAWAGEDPRHLEAFERVSALGERLGVLDAAARRQLLREFAPPAAARAGPGRRRFALAAAAAVAALVVGTGWLLWGRQPQRAGVAVEYASAVGQNRDIVLPDGSKVALGGASRLSVRYGGGERRVSLDAGEAYFQVVHDAQRPFVVAAGGLDVRDIGTSFDVRRTGADVAVAVTRGKVRIDERSAAPGAAGRGVDAAAGQRVGWSGATGVFSMGSTTPEQATAWRSDRLEFVGEPLAGVVANINRYSLRPLRIDGTGLAGLSFTGTVHVDELDGWLRALPQVFPLRVDERAHEVILSAQPASAARR